MTCNTRPSLTRLTALPQRPSRLQVDRTFPGRILGASLITTGPADGHDFTIDRTTVEQVAQAAELRRGRWTHGNLSDDGLAKHLGRWTNVRAEPFWLCRACEAEQPTATCSACGTATSVEWRAVGDFLFAKSAHQIRPDGLNVPAPVYLLDRAEEDPQSLGISVVARFTYEDFPAQASAGDETKPVRLARLATTRDLRRGDWVADPAANPVGLHTGTETPSALTEDATRALDRIVAREGHEKARLRALAFLSRYFGDTANTNPSDDDRPDRAPTSFETKLETHLAEQMREIATLRFRLRERERRDADDYLLELQTVSAELNAPIPAADLAKVRRFLDRGDLESARDLGEAFLAQSQAAVGPRFETTTTHALTPDPDKQKAVINARVSLLRRRGFRVEVSDDGTQILSTTPPPKVTS